MLYLVEGLVYSIGCSGSLVAQQLPLHDPVKDSGGLPLNQSDITMQPTSPQLIQEASLARASSIASRSGTQRRSVMGTVVLKGQQVMGVETLLCLASSN